MKVSRGNDGSLSVRPKPVEGWAVMPFMVRQAHHERLNLNLSRLKWVALIVIRCDNYRKKKVKFWRIDYDEEIIGYRLCGGV